MNIALIGPTGVGKGTHSEKLVEKFDLVHISTGQLFRKNLEMKTALGLLAKKYMTQGELVPDEVVDSMIEAKILRTDPNKGIIFDGYPRTRYQAEFLEDLFARTGRHLDAVIYLKVSDEEVIKRLMGRMQCHNCPSIFHNIYRPFKNCQYDKCENGEHLYHAQLSEGRNKARLQVFHRVAGPLVYYFQRKEKLIIVDGEPDIDEVYQLLVNAIGAVQTLKGQLATVEETERIDALKAATPAIKVEDVAHRSLDIVLVGAPGSGKGTQAEQLRTTLNLPHIATGDLFRENLKNETDLGKLAKSYMDQGRLVPDDVTEAMVQERLSRPDTQNGFILDGFPRTLPQVEALTEMMNNMNRRIAGVLFIDVSDEEIVRRLSGRVICKECQTPFHTQFNPFKKCPYNKCEGEHLYQRDDDNPATIEARLKTYHGQTAPLIDYYKEAGLLHQIPGEGELSEITEKSLAIAGSLLQ